VHPLKGSMDHLRTESYSRIQSDNQQVAITLVHNFFAILQINLFLNCLWYFNYMWVLYNVHSISIKKYVHIYEPFKKNPKSRKCIAFAIFEEVDIKKKMPPFWASIQKRPWLRAPRFINLKKKNSNCSLRDTVPLKAPLTLLYPLGAYACV
jgi:hypothetical protein